MLGTAFGWLIGCLVTHWLPVLPSGAWLIPASVAAIAALRLRAAPCILAALLGGAWTVHVAQARLLERLSDAAAGRDVELRGWIDSFPRTTAEQTSFSLRVDARADRAAVPSRVRLVWYRPALVLTPGDALEVVVRLRHPRGLANPGGSDAERWALIEGIGATGYVRTGRHIERPMQLDRWWLTFRANLAERLRLPSVSPQASALVIALALGERTDFTDAHWAHLSRTGTSHLVAISGLHVALFASLLFVVARQVCLRMPARLARHDLELASVFALAAGAIYSALAGFTLPTQRSVVMLVVGLLVIVSRRRCRLIDALGIALVFVLVWDPFGPLRASFWLSFGAVALIGLAASVRMPQQRQPRLLSSVRRFVEVQWAVTIGLAPVIAIFFAQLGIISPLVNMLAVPFFSFVLVPAVLASLVLAAVSGDTLLEWWLPWVGWLCDLTWSGLARAAEFEFASIVLAPPAPWAMLLAVVGALVLLPGACPGRSRWAAATLLGALAQAYGPRPGAGEAQATILDVGHGLAVLVRTARHALLYDTGPRFPSGFDAGRAAVLPAAVALGIRRLDRIIVSHADVDHAGGMPAVFERFPDAVWLVGPDVELPGSRPCTAGQQWHWDGVDFSFLHPLPDSPGQGNSSSCVLLIEAPGRSLLLTGDIESDAESALVARGSLRAASVVVMPHHGSATSSSHAFVERLRPEVAIASAGYANRWNFPRPEVSERWRRTGAEIWVTGDAGAVTVTLVPGHPLRLSGERARRKRYWSTDRTPVSGASDTSAL
jgi:competence protein ComEC